LLDIGPDCLQPLVANLESQDNVFSKAWQKYWPKLPRGVRNALPRPVPRAERRATAAWALGQIGPAARPVSAALVAALDDSENRVRAEAAQALRYVNPRASGAIAALARRLSDPTPLVRSRAAEALWNMAPESRAALPALIQLLHDPDLAHLAASCMQELGPLASNAVPDLIDVVKQGVAGHPPKRKFSFLHSVILEDPSAHNRAMAAKALGKIGIANAEVLDTLQAALKYPPTWEGAPRRLRPWVCQNAAQALGDLGTNALSAIPALVLMLGDTNLAAPRAAALALGAMGLQAQSALPALKNLLSELPDPLGTGLGVGEDRKWELFWLRGSVALAISQIDPNDRIALAVLLDHADADYAGRRRIAELGAGCRELVPKLSERLAHTNGQPQTAKAELLWHLDPQNPAVVPALTHAMGQTNSALRAHAAFWYWKVTGDADTTMKVLVAGLDEPPSPASQMFPQWLGDMEAAARPAVSALKKALWHHDIYARRNAEKALKKIDPTALEFLNPP